MQEHDTPKKIAARIDSALKDFNEDSQAMADAVGWKTVYSKSLKAWVRKSFESKCRY